MAYKLSIQDSKLGLSFEVKYENLDKLERPEIEAKAPDGSIVKERTVYQGTVLVPGSTQRQWVDDAGNVYNKAQLKFFYQGQEVTENSQTKTYVISGYQPLKNYTDTYVISKYYELFPHNNDMKKDYDKEVARISNLIAMRKLWEYLHQNKLVARGEFSPASKGFIAGDAYLRSIEIGNQWGLELGTFSQEKKFEHLNENSPIVAPVQTAAPSKRLKMV